ncbi:AfsR/SARP family transcriptional regulator [Parafrankia sp. FMc2]|uniref:AfsR/SARP family transcriptional regulator n=1 Tax=Parafrankia sp. FMc2 TaxID=3233196 RepID=UPI0034D5F119
MRGGQGWAGGPGTGDRNVPKAPDGRTDPAGPAGPAALGAPGGSGRAAEADLPLISVLGDLTVSRRGVALDLGGRRQRAVLGLLVIARGDAVAADRLIDLLWADRPPSGPHGALQSYVSHLRRALEPERAARSRGTVIVRMGSGYALRVAPDAVDAWRFEQLVRRSGAGAEPQVRVDLLTTALGLWRGPAFAEYRDEAWARPEAARLAELREVAREQLIEGRLGRGETAVVVPELEALVAEQPLREERWRLLVLALYRAQRQGDALAALRRARQVLADELGGSRPGAARAGGRGAPPVTDAAGTATDRPRGVGRAPVCCHPAVCCHQAGRRAVVGAAGVRTVGIGGTSVPVPVAGPGRTGGSGS